MVYCFAFGCNHQSLREHCKFFRFPLKDAELLGQWKTACRRADRDPNQYDRLCSCHFKDCKKENGPTLFVDARDKAKEGQAAGGSRRPSADSTAAAAAAAATRASTGVGSVAAGVRRKRLRIEFVSFGLQNGKLKRLSSAVAPGPGQVKEERAASGKPKPSPPTGRAAAAAAATQATASSSPSPPASPVPARRPDEPSPQEAKDQATWLRTVDRIRCLAFREARDAGASFISVRWVANCLNRSAAFVKKHWRGRYQDCQAPNNVSFLDADDDESENEEAASRPPPRVKVAEAAAAAVSRQESLRSGAGDDSHADETEGEALHEDWDPILEERNLIEGLLLSGSADEDADTNGAADGDARSLSSLAPVTDLAPTVDSMGRQLMHSLSPSPGEPPPSTTAVPRRHPQRGKTTPRTRTEAALAEKNSLEEEEEENAPLKCGQCGRKFSTAANLERHIRLHGVSVGPFVCPQCGSTGGCACQPPPASVPASAPAAGEGPERRQPLRLLSPDSRRAYWAAVKRRQRLAKRRSRAMQERPAGGEEPSGGSEGPPSPCVMSPAEQQSQLQRLCPAWPAPPPAPQPLDGTLRWLLTLPVPGAVLGQPADSPGSAPRISQVFRVVVPSLPEGLNLLPRPVQGT